MRQGGGEDSKEEEIEGEFSFLNHREKKEDTVQSQMFLSLWWFQGLSDTEWDPCLGHWYGSLPSQGVLVPMKESRLLHERTQEEEVATSVWGGISLLKDEATPIGTFRKRRALDHTKLQNSFIYRQHCKL